MKCVSAPVILSGNLLQFDDFLGGENGVIFNNLPEKIQSKIVLSVYKAHDVFETKEESFANAALAFKYLINLHKPKLN